MKKILILEDDELISALEKDYLEVSNYEVEVSDDGTEGLNKALSNEYDLIILDVMLPGMDGFDICKEIRKISQVPIIMVTAKKSDLDKIRGLGFGADDYMVKPFSPAELVARVKAHINIHERLIQSITAGAATEDAGGRKPSTEGSQHNISVKELFIDTLSHRVRVRGQEVTLANKEYELLVFLAENANIVFSKETLFDKVWGFDAIGDISTVTVHINRIREKIEKDMSTPEYIETIWGAGYRFCSAE